jgi:hypothetical protein
MVVDPNGEDFCKVFRIFCQKVLEYVPVKEPTAYATSEQVNTTSEKEISEKKTSKSPKVSIASL